MKEIKARAVWWDAVRFCGRNAGPIASMAVFPVILCTVLVVAFQVLTDPGTGKKSPGETFALSLASICIYLAFVPYYVALHRLTLLGEPGGVRSSWPKLDYQETRYALWALLIGVLYAAFHASSPFPGSDAGTAMELLSWLAALAWLYLLVRAAFVFVGIAVESQGGIRRDWQSTSGHGVRLLLIGLYSAAPLYIPLMVAFVYIHMAAGQPSPAADPLNFAMRAFLGATTQAAMGALWVTATSMAYRDVTGWRPAAQRE